MVSLLMGSQGSVPRSTLLLRLEARRLSSWGRQDACLAHCVAKASVDAGEAAGSPEGLMSAKFQSRAKFKHQNVVFRSPENSPALVSSGCL